MLKLNSDNYFSADANKEYMSNSQYKAFIPQFGGCEAASMAQINGEYEPFSRDAFLQGSYGHSWNEGKLEEFRMAHPEMFSSRGTSKGQLKTQYKKIGDCIEILENDPLVMAALAGQKEIIFTAELFGMPWKCCIDSYNPEQGRFADLKFLKSLYDKKWNTEVGVYENVFEAYGYYMQLALYAEIERLATGRDKHLEPFLVVATKETVPDHDIISFNSDSESYEQFISQQLAIASSYAERVKAVKYGGAKPIRCEKCDYCKATKKLTGTTHYSAFELY